MNVALEGKYRLNGSDSRIHCIDFDFKEHNKIEYHYHEYIEILFFLSGNGFVSVNGENHPYNAKTLVIVNSHRAHAIDILQPSRYICIKVMPDIFYGDEFSYALPFISETQNSYVFTAESTNEMEIAPLIQAIMAEWNEMSYGFEPAIRSQLLEFFVRVLRYLHKSGEVCDVKNIAPEIQTAIMYVADNFTTVTERELAQVCHLSYNYFSYLFKKTMGKSFKDYLLDTKIYQAEKMLLSTKKSITEIAQETGFSTTSHFISQFKKKNGTTPAKFKKARS